MKIFTQCLLCNIVFCRPDTSGNQYDLSPVHCGIKRIKHILFVVAHRSTPHDTKSFISERLTNPGRIGIYNLTNQKLVSNGDNLYIHNTIIYKTTLENGAASIAQKSLSMYL